MPRQLSSNGTAPHGERALIRALARSARASGQRFPQLRMGIGDDCAVLRVPRGHELTVTTDLLLENRHFRREWHSPEEAGHRCLGRGLSDLAAMGAKPLAAFLSFALPPELVGEWAERFLGGLLALARAVRVPLAGGDTAEAPGVGASALFTADIVLLGSVPAGGALLRGGTQAGDLLYVTGALGGSAAELRSLPTRPAARRLRAAGPGHPHLFPQPRLAQGLRLRPLATAAIDISDGLSTDLSHLCESSGLAAEVEASRIPIHALALPAPDRMELALHGGEDYELLFTAAPETKIPRSIAGVPVTRIGRMLAPEGSRGLITLAFSDGTRKPLDPGGWEHFREPAARS